MKLTKPYLSVAFPNTCTIKIIYKLSNSNYLIKLSLLTVEEQQEKISKFDKANFIFSWISQGINIHCICTIVINNAISLWPIEAFFSSIL